MRSPLRLLGNPTEGLALLVAPVTSALGLAGYAAVAALEAVLLDVDAGEALGAAPPLLGEVAVGPPLGRLLFPARRRGGSGRRGRRGRGRPAPPTYVLLVVLAIMVPAVVQPVEVVVRPRAPLVVARVRLLLRRIPVNLPVMPLQVRLALERLRVAASLETEVAVLRSRTGGVAPVSCVS